MGIETLRRTSLAVCLLLIPWGTCGKGSIHNAHCIRPSVSLHAVHRPCWHSGQRYPSLIKCRSHLALFMRTQLYLGHQNASDYRFLQPVKPWGNSQIERSVRHPRQARDHQPLPRFKRKHIDTRPRLHERSPRMRRASCMSCGKMVTRLAWMAHRLVSSKRPTRYASAASCRSRIRDAWRQRSNQRERRKEARRSRQAG